MGSVASSVRGVRTFGHELSRHVASRSAGARRQHTSTECFETPRFGVSRPMNHFVSSKRTPTAHRVRALARELDAGRAPVRAVAGVGVLVVRVEVVVLVEHDARGPPAAAHLPLDRPEPIGREVHVVVLVRLRDRSRLVHLEEVHRDAEVHGREIREAVRGRLVRHRVRVAQVLDRDRAPALRLLQERHRMLFGHQQRSGQVVGLHALAQELGVARGLGVPEDAARQRLQHRGARVALRREPAREVQPAVLDVGDAAGGLRQVGHVVQREAEMGGDVGCRPLGERATRVIDRGAAASAPAPPAPGSGCSACA